MKFWTVSPFFLPKSAAICRHWKIKSLWRFVISNSRHSCLLKLNLKIIYVTFSVTSIWIMEFLINSALASIFNRKNWINHLFNIFKYKIHKLNLFRKPFPELMYRISLSLPRNSKFNTFNLSHIYHRCKIL